MALLLCQKLRGLNSEARIVMEHTGRYYEPFAMSMYRAGFFVSAVNPLVIKDYREGVDVPQSEDRQGRRSENRPVRFLTEWRFCRNILPWIRFIMTSRRCRQFQLSGKTRTALNNNLIALLEAELSRREPLLRLPSAPGRQPVESISWIPSGTRTASPGSARPFVERYRKWCKRHG